MAKKAQKEQKPIARLKKKGVRPQTKRIVKKSALKKKIEATKKETEKSEPTPRQPKKLSSQEWIEAFLFSLVVVQLQEFFRWCWENIDKKQARNIAAALYREIFFPFESMPEHKRLPIWRHTKVARFVHSLTSANAALLEKITQQWAEETGRDIDSIRRDKR